VDGLADLVENLSDVANVRKSGDWTKIRSTANKISEMFFGVLVFESNSNQ
jgi:hypothetical protein